MSNQYSDNYAVVASATPGLLIAVPAIKMPWGVSNRHYKRASAILDLAPVAFTIADICRMITVKSIDRIHTIYVSASGGTAVAADLGFYKSGNNHDGAVVDVDRIASAITLAGTVARTERMIESGDLKDTDRGRAVWELLGLSADSGLEYDVCFTATATLTTADALVNLEILGSFQ